MLSLHAHPSTHGWVAGRLERLIMLGEFPKECLSIHSFLLRNSSCSSLLLPTVAWLLPQPNSPAQLVTVGVKACCATQPLQCPQPPKVLTDSPGVFASTWIPPSAAQTLFGWGGSSCLSTLPRTLWQTQQWALGLGLQPPDHTLVPGTLPCCSTLLRVRFFGSTTILGPLFSHMLKYVGCLLLYSIDRSAFSPLSRGKLNLLLPTLTPS
ncbi:hypothetical protein HJG60_010830 [Phyllostomus discolor]|uniref:Uncharacterized protein n=1 Tax=Phyllostomus discolor TaxID=89673 RepID=A0A834ADY4_9CHIR|nr:hypothetical protein HJG60_010830 [Phyllostomus discolor]